MIATCRPTWEGGRFDGSEDTRRQLLERALAAGAEYVDVEWKAGFDDFVQANRSRVVLSSHDFTGVPADLCTRARRDARHGCRGDQGRRDGGAPVGHPAAASSIAKQGDAVVIGMGDAGVPSRLLATRFGSRWTYGGNGVAPGQIPAARMVDEFRFRAITEQTSVYGLAGAAALTSGIPAMRNAAFAAAGVDAVCVPLPAADPADIQTFADALGIIGWERCM